ncbi:helix-turn-helix transcriptional regulator [Anaerococcus sp.]|uniref:helix-turn-helix domain-containing protein n=1 Tax=Anaerococcus sp. TaxID=1872515 RepID=UPI00280A5886|nr:helix-turn-helix transcriptional regulator [Anaerococcus sp.]MDU3176678.1 helix-turn-helix transcriptional regulator [Anaerococcus sp.]
MEAKFQPDRLLKLREELNISRAEAARRMQLSHSGYANYEDDLRNPSAQVIFVMSLVFKTSVDYLTGLTDDPKPDQILIDVGESDEIFVLLDNFKELDREEQGLVLDLIKILNDKKDS